MRLASLFVVTSVACGSPSRPAPAPPPMQPAALEPPPVAPPKVSAPLAYLDGTLATLASKYLDPSRFDFRKMLRGALDGMEDDIAEVIAESANDRVTVRVDEQQRTFAGDVDSLAELGIRLTEIVRFVQEHANATTDRREIELFAVNGMLRTLDPHTFVIPAKDMEEWNVNLSGKFGGLGIVITMHNDRVAVQKVHANTPAQRGGLEVGDVILAINGQPTESLTIDEAMSRLRGDPGSAIKLQLERAGKQLELPFTRAEIQIPVVESRMLDGKVGYVMIDHFAESTAIELERAMTSLKEQGARAWVVDLRENPGGYLSQAVKSADQFVEYGTIVATVAGGKKHDIKNATTGGADTRSPVVVLVGERTASSAEILAGALKQLDRAVLVGRRTFGKGSVQVLEDAAHGAKLKITTAEYVASNDVSPQGGGIVPDVELIPAQVPKQITENEPLRLVPEPPAREVDLGAHLDTTQKQDSDKPIATIAYRRIETEEPDQDFEVRFARDLALAAKARTRRAALAAVPRVVAKTRVAAEREISEALKALGVDWQRGRAGAKLATKFDANVKTSTGELVTLHGEVTNTGTTPAFRVHARATSDDPVLDGIEMAFGKIPPGGTKQATALVRLSRGSAARASTIKWRLDGAEATTELAIAATPFPEFALTTQLADDNDGVARSGEPLRVRAHVTNRGPGRAAKTIATLKSLVGERLLVDRGRVEIGPLEAMQSKDVELVFGSKADSNLERISLELGIADANLDTGQTQRLDLAVGSRVAGAKWELTPPRIRIADVPLETKDERVRIAGSAEDEHVVADLYITTSNRGAKVEERKVFYAAGKKPKLEFTADVPLALGVNRIVVVAREHDKSQAVRTVWVVRR